MYFFIKCFTLKFIIKNPCRSTKFLFTLNHKVLYINTTFLIYNMEALTKLKLIRDIRIMLSVFIVLLVLSGITAFPLETELSIMVRYKSLLPIGCQHWILEVYNALVQTNKAYPYLSYGTDWLAFAHLVIAVVFIGPLKDPVKNIWVIQFGMIACVMVFPLALIAGPIRGIPFYWQLIDCSFGIFGLIPLYICHKKIRFLENETNTKSFS